jgi:hypothetical protein
MHGQRRSVVVDEIFHHAAPTAVLLQHPNGFVLVHVRIKAALPFEHVVVRLFVRVVFGSELLDEQVRTVVTAPVAGIAAYADPAAQAVVALDPMGEKLYELLALVRDSAAGSVADPNSIAG